MAVGSISHATTAPLPPPHNQNKPVHAQNDTPKVASGQGNTGHKVDIKV